MCPGVAGLEEHCRPDASPEPFGLVATTVDGGR
jgi:hypothetical protein